VGGIAEMKRMWLRARFRGKGVGRALAETLIAAAREEGYGAVRLETLSVMPHARELYRSMGFTEVPHPSAEPFPGSMVMERLL
jgi:GNAT superfamily N-acetyltransferase